jgi:hypothetical protein
MAMRDEDPWAWAQEHLDEIKPASNTVPELKGPVPIDKSIAPNIQGGGPGMLTQMAYGKAASAAGDKAYQAGSNLYQNMAFEAADKAQLAGQGLNDAAINQVTNPSYAPLNNPAPVSDAVATPVGEAATTTAETVAAPLAQTGTAAATGTSGAALAEGAGATAETIAAQQASLLAAQQASAAAMAEGAAASGVAATNFWNPVGWAAAAYAAYKLSQAS